MSSAGYGLTLVWVGIPFSYSLLCEPRKGHNSESQSPVKEISYCS